uniref:Uncharacterized protein n=1 Tax=Cucumis melo TaxID=3656 RepID=A0A9I9EIR2_CUCME
MEIYIFCYLGYKLGQRKRKNNFLSSSSSPSSPCLTPLHCESLFRRPLLVLPFSAAAHRRKFGWDFLDLEGAIGILLIQFWIFHQVCDLVQPPIWVLPNCYSSSDP